MTLLLDLAVRSSVLVIVGLGLALLLRRQPAALRHAVLAMAIFAAAAVAPLAAIVPAWYVAAPDAAAAPVARPASVVMADEPIAISPREAGRTAGAAVLAIAPFAWAAGMLGCAAGLLAGFARLRRVARRARQVRHGEWWESAEQIRAACGIRRPVSILLTDTPDLLATFGLRRPRVLLPAHASEWSRERMDAVLWHELAHIRRHDWLVQMIAEALRCLYWFNPLMWIACARLRSEGEHACDDAVLGGGMAPREYARHLLALARACRRPRSQSPIAAMPMARPSTLERRITAMLNPNLNRASVSWRAAAAAAALLVALSWSVAAARAGQVEQTVPATLAGRVYDPSGGVLPGVTVTLKDAQDTTQKAMTNANGQFEFPSVAPGTYVLEASLPGFKTLRQNLTLRAERDWDRAITLQVGDVRESVVVSAARVGTVSVSQAQPAGIRVGGNIRAPRKLRDVKPVYPVSMQEAGREGVVSVEATIGADGSVSAVRVLSADIHPDFAIAAVDAVRQWRFAPTLLNGVAVEIRMTVSVEFRLSN